MDRLYVGFKGKGNSSNKIVSSIIGEKLFLTNSFDGLKRDIENISKSYESIYMFGLDKSLKGTVRIESAASCKYDIHLVPIFPLVHHKLLSLYQK